MAAAPTRIHGFAPVAAASAHSLILGSMPGVASLEAAQYYAHPRNAFWWIIDQLFAIDSTAPYEQRLQQLSSRGFLLWDVLKSCERPGSLDSAIAPASIETNDFASLLSANASIQRVFLNGGAAYKLWQKQVVPTLKKMPVERLPVATQLPSTSPAYAAMSRESKLQQWRVIALPPK